MRNGLHAAAFTIGTVAVAAWVSRKRGWHIFQS